MKRLVVRLATGPALRARGLDPARVVAQSRGRRVAAPAGATLAAGSLQAREGDLVATFEVPDTEAADWRKVRAGIDRTGRLVFVRPAPDLVSFDTGGGFIDGPAPAAAAPTVSFDEAVSRRAAELRARNHGLGVRESIERARDLVNPRAAYVAPERVSMAVFNSAAEARFAEILRADPTMSRAEAARQAGRETQAAFDRRRGSR